MGKVGIRKDIKKVLAIEFVGNNDGDIIEAWLQDLYPL